MFELHILSSQRAEDEFPVGGGVACDHGDWLSTDGDAIRCCKCLSQLVMVPHAEGEFRLEWLKPSGLAVTSL
jgi:hypothetical protein